MRNASSKVIFILELLIVICRSRSSVFFSSPVASVFLSEAEAARVTAAVFHQVNHLHSLEPETDSDFLGGWVDERVRHHADLQCAASPDVETCDRLALAVKDRHGSLLNHTVPLVGRG